MTTERAVLAGGCFWGMQDLIRKMPGVQKTRVGYTGGDVKNATYRNHGTHAEAVEIIFDPAMISYRRILEFFFQIHDPTTLNRQGPDIGTQYRSAIFFTTGEQEKAAQESKTKLEKSGKFSRPITTVIVPAADFYRAEDYHQRYLEKRGLSQCHIPTAD